MSRRDAAAVLRRTVFPHLSGVGATHGISFYQMTETSDIVNLVSEGIRERKGRNITHIDLTDVESATVNNFVICEGTSTMHVASIADSIRDYLLEHAGLKPYNYDGYRNSQWIVIDYGDTMVHVFAPEMRKHYDLEELWSDAPATEIPDEI